MQYPITVHQEPDHVWSTCADIPEAHSAADTIPELVATAVDGLRLALTIYVDQNRAIPAPSAAAPGQHLVPLPVQATAKVLLWNAMVAKGMRVADLARLLQLSHPAAGRLVDFEHNSKIEQVEAALLALGKRLVVTAEDAKTA